jgi:hypothetical protein
MIIENYTENSVKEQKYSFMQTFFFFIFFKVKDVF